MTGPEAAFRAVLFDFGDTLFHRRGGHLARGRSRPAARRRASADADAKRQWDAVQAAARMPEELAKGRDLSRAAHREAWTALYRPTDRIAPGMAELLYEREVDPDSWVPFPDAVARRWRRFGRAGVGDRAS